MNLENKKFLAVIAALISLLLASCKNSGSKPLIIWTDNAEIVSYVELFNATHEDISAFAVYKDEAARSLPPAKDELTPDLVVGSWLKNSATRKYFQPLDYLFQEKSLNRTLFYKQLLEYGQINDKQYLIPISFNLPAMIFSKKNEGFVESEHFLNLEQIRTFSTAFNKKNKNGTYTAMGYAPSWDTDFTEPPTTKKEQVLYGTKKRWKLQFPKCDNGQSRVIPALPQSKTFSSAIFICRATSRLPQHDAFFRIQPAISFLRSQMRRLQTFLLDGLNRTIKFLLKTIF